MVESEVTSKPM